jgi:hypothetical protein
MLAYSTSPGKVAFDGEGDNGLYTTHLLKEFAVKGIKVEDAFKRTRLGVRMASKGLQVPWETTSLEDDLYLFPDSRKNLSEAEQHALFERELQAWAAVKTSTSLPILADFIRQYPSGSVSELAASRLNRLQAAQRDEQEPSRQLEAARLAAQAAEAKRLAQMQQEQLLLQARAEAAKAEEAARLAQAAEAMRVAKQKQDQLLAQAKADAAKAAEEARLAQAAEAMRIAKEQQDQRLAQAKADAAKAAEEARLAQAADAMRIAKEQQDKLLAQAKADAAKAAEEARLTQAAEAARRAQAQQEQLLAQAKAEAAKAAEIARLVQAAEVMRIAKEAQDQLLAQTKAEAAKAAEAARLAQANLTKVQEQDAAKEARLSLVRAASESATAIAPMQLAATPFYSGSTEHLRSYAIGDTYEFQIIDSFTKASKPLVMKVTQVDPAAEVVQFNGGEYSSDLMGNILANLRGSSSTPRQFYPAEIMIGKRWRTQFVQNRPGGVSYTFRYDLKVVAKERVTVPAGTFDTFKIEARGFNMERGASLQRNIWIAPSINADIAHETIVRLRGGQIEQFDRQELVRFTQKAAVSTMLSLARQ